MNLILRWTFTLAVCCGTCLAVVTDDSQDAPLGRPNILFIFVDDLQAEAIAAFGHIQVQTPNIDQLVRSGTAFTRCYIQGSSHGAVCAPSRAMVLTGRHLFRRGTDNCGDYPLWPETFRNAGYTTFFTGKWHNQQPALQRSFEHIARTGPGMYPSTTIDGDAYRRPAELDTWRPADTSRKGHWLERDGGIIHSSEYWANQAIDFLKTQHNTDQPFFAYVSFHAPHDPRQSPQEFLDLYPVEDISNPPNYMPEHPFDQGSLKIRDELLAPHPRTEAAVGQHLAEYYAIITHLDAQIGRVLDALNNSSHADHTLIIFASDNGLAMGQHGLFGKQNLYEHSVRVPLILSGPNIPIDRRIESPVYLHALFATTCELADIATPDTIDAPSLVPLFSGDSLSHQKTLFAAYAAHQRMVRDQRFKLIIYPKVHRIQLFDLQHDPWELHNLADDPDDTGTIHRLHTALLEWMDETNDDLPRESIAEPWEWISPIDTGS